MKKGHIHFVCMCLQTQSTTELKQRLTKSMPRRRSNGGAFIQGKNTFVRNWGVKRGVGVCSKGAYFRELNQYIAKESSCNEWNAATNVVARLEEAMYKNWYTDV